MLTDIRALADHFLIALPNINNCHDPKMEAYCKEVRRLEDKFHSLELVHVARRYNEAAEELAKIASTRGTVPPDTFSRDLHEPSVNLGSLAGVEIAPAQQTDAVDLGSGAGAPPSRAPAADAPSSTTGASRRRQQFSQASWMEGRWIRYYSRGCARVRWQGS